MSINFQALVLEQEDRQTLAEVRELSVDDLPEQANAGSCPLFDIEL